MTLLLHGGAVLPCHHRQAPSPPSGSSSSSIERIDYVLPPDSIANMLHGTATAGEFPPWLDQFPWGVMKAMQRRRNRRVEEGRREG